MVRVIRLSSVLLLFLATLPVPPCSRADVPTTDSSIPFTLTRNKVLVPVRVNGSRPLRLILDSGMGLDGVLLFDRALKDSIGSRRLQAARIPGAGGGPPSEAFVADSASLGIGDVQLPGQRVIVLGDSAMKGPASDGVIGYSLLGHYAVEIDYGRMRVVLHDAQSFRPARGWTALPLALNDRNWPFLDISVAVGNGTPTPLRAYIDFASGENVELLTKPGMKFTLPPETKEVVLGRGLSGDIRGRRGAVSRLLIGTHELRDLQAAFVPAEIRSKAGNADAVLSNGALSRFDVVFDYAHSTLYLKPNGRLPDLPN